jgi:Uma2 family endonuclease
VPISIALTASGAGGLAIAPAGELTVAAAAVSIDAVAIDPWAATAAGAGVRRARRGLRDRSPLNRATATADGRNACRGADGPRERRVPTATMSFVLPPPSAIRPLGGAEYDRLVEAGAFDDQHVELLDGWLVAMTPHGPEHDGTIDVLQELLVAALAGRALVRIQSTLVVGRDSRPEPDLAVVPRADYRDAHPAVAHLVVEVAHSSIARDRSKTSVYARAGVPEYWLVDLVHSVVEVHRAPDGACYAQSTVHRRPETLLLLAFPDVVIALDRVLRR